MHVGHTEIFVSDPLTSKEFYVDVLGFTLMAVQGEQFVWLTSGGMQFLLRPQRRAAGVGSYQQAASALALYTDDLDATVAELEAKGVVMKGTDGSGRCLTFTDPDGNWFQLVNPLEH
jgi:catechol 2,3-dioxygenase-like lactoylglutathione lyase family enzyme